MAYFNRGNAEKNLKQQQAAIASYSKAIEISPSYVDAYYNRGNVYRDIHQFEAAIKDYEKALSIKPNYEFLLGQKLHYKMKICD